MFKTTIFKNPNTTLSALAVAIAGLLTAFQLITAEQGAALVALATAIGLALSGDAK